MLNKTQSASKLLDLVSKGVSYYDTFETYVPPEDRETISLLYTKFSSLNELLNVLMIKKEILDKNHKSYFVVSLFKMVLDYSSMHDFINNVHHPEMLVYLRLIAYGDDTNENYYSDTNDSIREHFINRVIQIEAKNEWVNFFPKEKQLFEIYSAIPA